MSKLTPRPDWPDGREPISGGLRAAELLIRAAIVVIILALSSVGCWLLWWTAVMVESL